MTSALAFPFRVSATGRIRLSGDDDSLRAKIVQVLFTAPGERVELPEFGCGLFNLVFEPNGELVEAATSFTVSQALGRWLGDLIVVTGVNVASDDGTITVEVAYTKRLDLSNEAVRIKFHEGSAWRTA